MNERNIEYVATFHGLNGFENLIQTYPSKDGLGGWQIAAKSALNNDNIMVNWGF